MRNATLGNELSSGGLSELWRRLFFVLISIVIFRLGAHIPVPGVSHEHMARLFNQGSGGSGGGQGLLGLLDMFSGGAFSKMTIFALSIMPYISSSIIVQMYSSISPKLIQLKKEGETGRRKINFYTRSGTLVLGMLQAVFISSWLLNSGAVVSTISPVYFYMLSVTSLVTGTMFLLWLGEQMTERGIGNGISLIIFSGIVARFPAALHKVLGKGSGFSLINLLLVLLIIIFVTLAVVFVERAQRRILVKYAKRQQASRTHGTQQSHLPLKINMSGVIPPIFAQSILMFFLSIPQFTHQFKGLPDSLGWIRTLFSSIGWGSNGYMVLFAVLVIFFGFFYTALVFNPKEMSDNLSKSGGYIDGIRPGDSTADYIDGVMTRLTCVGTIYLALVSLLPYFLMRGFHVPFYFGGTSLLIVVVVLMDLIAQVQSHVLSSKYHALMNKARSKGARGGFLRG